MRQSETLPRFLSSHPCAVGEVLTLALGPSHHVVVVLRIARRGFVPVSLGPQVLRVETAAISLVAGVVFWLDGAGRHGVPR